MSLSVHTHTLLPNLYWNAIFFPLDESAPRVVALLKVIMSCCVFPATLHVDRSEYKFSH